MNTHKLKRVGEIEPTQVRRGGGDATITAISIQSLLHPQSHHVEFNALLHGRIAQASREIESLVICIIAV